jgi:hypothetical protein
MTWLTLSRSDIPSGFMLGTWTLLLLFIQTLVLRSTTVGRRPLWWVRSSRRSIHCLRRFKLWSNKAWLDLGLSLASFIVGFNLWSWGPISDGSSSVVDRRSVGAPQEGSKGGDRCLSYGPRVPCWSSTPFCKLFCSSWVLSVFLSSAYLIIFWLLVGFGVKFWWLAPALFWEQPYWGEGSWKPGASLYN